MQSDINPRASYIVRDEDGNLVLTNIDNDNFEEMSYNETIAEDVIYEVIVGNGFKYHAMNKKIFSK